MNFPTAHKRFLLLAAALIVSFLTISFVSLRAMPTGTYQVYLPLIEDLSNLSGTTIIPYSASWKYLDDGNDPGSAWRSVAFDDSGWQEGFGELGYGDGYENTEVTFGSDANNKQITTYFRRSFTVDNPANYRALELHLLRDDGAVVYLNDQEILRSNMPDGSVISSTLALTPILTPEENSFQIYSISPAFLNSGDNVLAVEIHQASATSSDISFNLTMLATAVSPQPVRFAAIGDYGRDNQSEQEVTTLIQSWEPDFVITVGDNSYGNNAIDENIGKYYADYINDYTGSYGAGSPIDRFFPALGNHDYTDGAGLQAYLDYFTLSTNTGNERYYDFVQGDVHFFVLDSNPKNIGEYEGNLPAPGDGQAPDSAQGIWLQNGLANSTQPWNIVYFHHAPYSSSTHGDSNASLNMRWPFAAWGATAVIGGHDHTYERFTIDGIPYFVNGLGVATTNRFCNEVVVDPLPEICHEQIHGAMRVEADTCQITFQFITHSNEIIDTYTIDNVACP